MPFNEKLKELRLRNNLTQAKLAKGLDVTTRTYIYYETGKKYPSVALLNRMADFFKVSISFLIDEQNETQAQVSQCVKLGTQQLIDGISSLFAGGELSETEKDSIMEALQDAYWTAKKKNKP